VTVALLRKLGKFTRLSSDDEAALARAVSRQLRHFSVHEDIMREGEAPQALSVVHEGWACRYKTLEDGRRQIIALFVPGDICDLNLFVLREMDHSIAAISAVTVGEINRRGFEQLMASSTRIAQALWWDSLVAAAIQREWTVSLGQRDAFERVAHLFCELFLRLESAGLTDGWRCDFPLTQTELGEATGLSAVHVNRTLQELRSAELIMLKDRVLTILDFEALRRAAMFNPAYLHLDREGRHLDANDI
jgi:CRP-like cAMP-binding protein